MGDDHATCRVHFGAGNAQHETSLIGCDGCRQRLAAELQRRLALKGATVHAGQRLPGRDDGEPIPYHISPTAGWSGSLR